MTTIGNAAWTCVVACCLLSGCRDAKQDTKAETSAQSASKAPSDEVPLTTQAQAEQKIEIAPVESAVATMPQRAQVRIALPDNASWRVGVLAEDRVEKVYFNLGDAVTKGQVLARMHSHDVHEVRAAYANAVAERSRLQAAEALAQKNYDRSQRLYALKAESVSQTETAKQELVTLKARPMKRITMLNERKHIWKRS
jgi:membrane fusion protein, heavy metal efflux system